jgi:flagellar basal-body rod protein FlgB
MTLFTDRTQNALERAMDGTALRQRVMSQNVANAMTPGYQAQKVEFEGALADALRNGESPQSVTPSVTGTGAPQNEDGNNVELETEATGMMRNGLQFDALVQATSYRLGVLRAAVR